MRVTRRKNLFKRNSLLQKMLFSILGLICIPLICIQLAMLIHANREFKRETTVHNQYALASLAAAFSSQLDEVSNTMYRMYIDEEITRYISKEISGYPLAQAAVKINRYALDSALLDSVGVYYVEKDVCLHNTFKRAVPHFCGDFFPEGTEGYVALADFLRNANSRDFFYTGNFPQVKRTSLIIAKAFSMGSVSKRDVVIFFVMDNSSFDRWCAMFVPTGESFAILDPEGNYLFRGEGFSQGVVQSADFQGFLADYEAVYIPEDDSGLIVYKYHEASTDNIFLVSMFRQTAEKTFMRYTTQAAFSVAVTVVLMVLLLSVTLYINYKPVSRLMQKHFQQEQGSMALSELELIDAHFFALDKRLNDQSKLLATFIMGDLLSGIQVEKSALEKHFPSGVYRNFIAAVSKTPLTAAQGSEVCQMFSGKLVVTSVPYQTELVFVYASEDTIDPVELQTQLIQAVQKVTDQCYGVRMGTVVNDVAKIQSSYSSALLSERLDGETNDSYLEGYPHTLVVEFSVCIGNRSWEKALQILNRLEVLAPTLKPSVKRFLHMKVLNAYLSSVQKSGYVLANSETDHLLSFTNGQHLFNMLRSSISMLQNTQEKVLARLSPDELRKRLLKYVDENFANSELCLTSAADYLNTSVYTISRIFKEATGYGFKEYISEQRLQQASRLLRESSMSVADIAVACGIENVNYFTAIFRMKYGLPPSKYRKEMTGISYLEDSTEDR